MVPEPQLPATERSRAGDLGAMGGPGIVAAFIAQAADIPRVLETQQAALATAIERIAERMGDGGRLVLLGAGTSGRLASMEASEVGPTFGLEHGSVIALTAERVEGIDPDDDEAVDAAEDDGPAARRALDSLGLTAADSVVGIAASGRTPFTLAGLAHARALGALTVSVACDHPSPMADVAEVVILLLVGPELLAGSTRLGAGTATKIVLDALTTGVMVRLGHVHRDRMVDMRAGNAKLRERAVRMVSDLTGRSDDRSRAALESVGWWSRAAIVCLELDLAPGQAIERAAGHRFLADALDPSVGTAPDQAGSRG